MKLISSRAPFLPHLCLCQESDDGKTYFLKIHAPWEVLATYADVLKIKVPFKASDIPHSQDVPLEWISRPFRLPEHIMHPEPDYFTSPFDKGKIDFFLINDKDTFFPPSTRNRIVSSFLKPKSRQNLNSLIWSHRWLMVLDTQLFFVNMNNSTAQWIKSNSV